LTVNDIDAAFPVTTQTSDSDKASFLKVQRLVEQTLDQYRYVEIGSYLGGTLSPHLRSAQCSKIFSIDIRIDRMWDERNRVISYEGVSTAQMLDHLHQHHSDSELEKLYTSDTDSSVLQSDEMDNQFDLALIDGEHTNTAVFIDFLNIRRSMREQSAVLFHDTNIVWAGIKNIRSLLDHEKSDYCFYYLPDNVGALLTGVWPETMHAALRADATDAEIFEENARVFLIRQTIRSNLKLAKRMAERFLQDQK